MEGKFNVLLGGGGPLNFGLHTMCHQKDPTFLLAFTERPPFLPTFTQWPPIFNKLLVTKRPWHIFVTQRPLIFAFDSQTSDKELDFSKISTNLTKCWEIIGHFGPESHFFMHFTEKPPYFCVLCHWKTPFFDAICHWKTPTSEVLGGSRTSLSYVSAHRGFAKQCNIFVIIWGPWLSSVRCLRGQISSTRITLI